MAHLDVQGLVSLLRGQGFRLTNERRLQGDLSEFLSGMGIEHVREVSLGTLGVIDFTIGTIGLEVKVKDSRMKIYRQMSRYAQHRELSALILATNVPMGFPPEIEGMPVYVVNLSRAWL